MTYAANQADHLDEHARLRLLVSTGVRGRGVRIIALRHQGDDAKLRRTRTPATECFANRGSFIIEPSCVWDPAGVSLPSGSPHPGLEIAKTVGETRQEMAWRPVASSLKCADFLRSGWE
jgi:hypothetical protein